MTIGIALDVIVALLLAAVVWSCILLNQRLANLRSGHDELARLISGLNQAISKAQDSVALLKRASEDAGDTLKEEVDKALGLRDELSLIIGSGNNLADRLEAVLVGDEKPVSERLRDAAPAESDPAGQGKPASQASDGGGGGPARELGPVEQEILKALSGVR
ncbi:MAG: DUF6468 domain-containing protein [Sphingomonadales bacterium]